MDRDDPRVIPVSKDEEQWPGLLEVGGEIIARGGLVVLPTDTLYGVGCDPFNASAVDALRSASSADAEPGLHLRAGLRERSLRRRRGTWLNGRHGRKAEGSPLAEPRDRLPAKLGRSSRKGPMSA